MDEYERAERDLDYTQRPLGEILDVLAKPVYPATCPTCRGTGGGQYNDCPTCDGNGVV